MIFHKQYDLWGILLPLGISFFTFQQISFIVDAYRGEVSQYGFLYYASFVTFFPQLIAGPIVTHDELIPQFLDREKKEVDWDNIAKGIYLFTIGLAKKILLADTFGNAVNWGYGNIEYLHSSDALIVILAYTFQIYFDFSGYCDMAAGIAKMLNIDLPVNFNSPYKSLTIIEFWDRWHITLTRFFTKYIYIPMGGSKKGKVRTYINILLVFLLSGFWHGADWSFVFWGICHGLFSVITRHFNAFFKQIPRVINWLITFSFVNVMWVFFRADSLDIAIQLLGRVTQGDFSIISKDILKCFQLAEIEFVLERISIRISINLMQNQYFILYMFLLVSILIILCCKNAYEKMKVFKPSVFTIFSLSFLLVWCIFSFSGVTTFLYFNF